jgi:hypothetical protein
MLFAEAYYTYVYDTVKKRKYIINQTEFKDKTKVIILYNFLEMIFYYYDDTIPAGTNMFTVDEIKDVIDSFNDIAGTEICYQSSF